MHLHMILNKFQRVTGLLVNLDKSSIIHSDLKPDDVAWLSELFVLKAFHIWASESK